MSSHLHTDASVPGRSRQAGQATTEFLIALLVMAPMFLGIYYFARYADVKHTAIQASRYVAFERALDPNFHAKSAAQLTEETRARFFVPISQNGGVISFRQNTTSLDPDGNRVPLWSDVAYGRLLKNFSDVSIIEANAGPLNSGVTVGNLHTKVGKLFGLPAGGVLRAEVTVPLSNVANFDVLSNIDIGLPGATAIGSGVWNASGAKGDGESVCSRVTPTIFGHYIKPVTDVLDILMTPFESSTPDIGRLLPDYVPPGSVSAGKKSVPYSNQNGNKC